MNNYKNNPREAERGDDHTQKHFHEHFLSYNHNGFIGDTEIIFIDKNDSSDPTRRKEFQRAI